MIDYRKWLPTTFPSETKSSKTPGDMFDLLSTLYAREIQSNPGDAYLIEHSNPRMIVGRIYAFAWYSPSIPSGGKILDWGCNHASDSCLIRAVFGDAMEVFGCDFKAPNAFPVFFDSAKLEYRQFSDPLKIPFEDNTFDAVIASGALEHAALDFEMLKELYRVIKSGGKLIITYLPNYFSWFEWVQEKRYNKEYNLRRFHWRRYKLAETKQLLKHHGFYPVIAGYQTAFWEQLLARAGFRKNQRTAVKIFSTIFPRHLLAGCLKAVGVKMDFM